MLARWSTWALSALALAAASSGCGAPFTTSDTTSSTTTGTGGAGGTTTGPTTTGGAGGTGGMVTSATTGGGGTGGTGGMPECTMAEQCPGVDSECRTRTCTAGVCGFSTPMALAASQVWGDCKARGCDGQGNLVIANNPMDFYNDANECTIDTCEGNTPKNKPAQGILCNSGMGVCNDAGACVECVSNDNNTCPALKHNCQAGRCVPFHCTDNIQDVNETAKDCGGPECAPCPDGVPCDGGLDCQSGVCQGQPKMCKPVNCNDGITNGTETDIDCGGKCAAQGLRCDGGKKCKAPDDCASLVCKIGVCQPPTCTDGVQNGNETGMDCGGVCKACFAN